MCRAAPVVTSVVTRYSISMNNSLKMLGVFLFLALLSGCSEPPYVHDEALVNRDHPDFGREITNRDTVSICYNTRGATPAEVARLAQEACGEFGKTAAFDQHDYTICPLSHPVAATFICVAPQGYGSGLSTRF